MTQDVTQTPDEIAGQSLAIIAECLYLMNLLVIPGIAFVILIWLYFKYEHLSPLAGCHLRQAFSASIWAGLILILVNALILLAGGYHSPYIWVIVILYFAICHSILVILGIFALVKALAGQKFHYPLIGPTS